MLVLMKKFERIRLRTICLSGSTGSKNFGIFKLNCFRRGKRRTRLWKWSSIKSYWQCCKINSFTSSTNNCSGSMNNFWLSFNLPWKIFTEIHPKENYLIPQTTIPIVGTISRFCTTTGTSFSNKCLICRHRVMDSQ